MKKIKNVFLSLLLVIAMPLSSALAQNASSGNASIGTTTAGLDLQSTAEHTVDPESDVTFSKEVYTDSDMYNQVPSHLNVSFNIPFAWYSQIVKVDYENQSVCGLKADGKAPVFLFSVNKVTGEQWTNLKEQVKGCTIIENKDGFITFVQKTDVKKFNKSADAQYHVKRGELDGVVASIRVK